MSSRFELVLGLLHLSQAAFISASLTSESPAIYSLDRSTKYGSRNITQYDMRYLLPLFPVLSSVNHIYSAVNNDASFRQKSTVQWAEYAASASIMLWIIASLSGVSDLGILTMIVVQNILMQYMGYLMQNATSKQDYNRLLFIGFALFFNLWIPIVLGFYTAIDIANDKISKASDDSVSIPGIVYYIVWFMFGMFCVFGLYPVFRPINDNKYNHRQIYGVLSFLTKSLLTWMVYFGVLRGRDREMSEATSNPEEFKEI